jgi:hypothetical protein
MLTDRTQISTTTPHVEATRTCQQFPVMGNGLIRAQKISAIDPSISSLPHRLKSFGARTVAALAESDRLLRLRILDDALIEFHKPTIILLFAPPDYGIEDLAEFLSQKTNLPILRAPDLSSLGPPSGNSSHSFNFADRLEFTVGDVQIMNELEIQLSQEKYVRGCILYDYPTSPKHYRFLSEVMNAQHIPFFFEIDPPVSISHGRRRRRREAETKSSSSSLTLSQLVRTLNERFDRWIDSHTERSYHLRSNPPISNLYSDIPTVENMYDDHTGTPLSKVPPSPSARSSLLTDLTFTLAS